MTHADAASPEQLKVAAARLAHALRQSLVYQAELGADGAPTASSEALTSLQALIERRELERERRAFASIAGPPPSRASAAQPAAERARPTPTPTPTTAPPTPARDEAAPFKPADAASRLADATRPTPATPTGGSNPYVVMGMLQSRPRPAPAAPPTPQPAAIEEASARPEPQQQQPSSLASIRDELGECQRCRLCETRKRLVFGAGRPDADLLFIGDAPGRGEDEAGEPFVGKAGELLDKMIVAMGLTREGVYLCNIVKCHTPDNREPSPEELARCEPFLARQIEAVRPRVIVTLGRAAAAALLRDSTTPLTRLRGSWHAWRGIPVMPTFHPNFVLRDPTHKRPVWEDLRKVMDKLGLKAPR